MKKIKQWYKNRKLRKFKKRKLRLARVSGEKTYHIYFSFLLLDKNKTHKIENLEIFIPAASAYDAKNNLMEFLTE